MLPCTLPLLLYPHPLLSSSTRPLSLGGRRVDGTNHSGHVVGGIAEIFMGFQFIDIHEPCGKTQGHVVGALHDAGGSGRG